MTGHSFFVRFFSCAFLSKRKSGQTNLYIFTNSAIYSRLSRQTAVRAKREPVNIFIKRKATQKRRAQIDFTDRLPGFLKVLL